MYTFQEEKGMASRQWNYGNQVSYTVHVQIGDTASMLLLGLLLVFSALRCTECLLVYVDMFYFIKI